jgi:hypothetical protein
MAIQAFAAGMAYCIDPNGADSRGLENRRMNRNLVRGAMNAVNGSARQGHGRETDLGECPGENPAGSRRSAYGAP